MDSIENFKLGFVLFFVFNKVIGLWKCTQEQWRGQCGCSMKYVMRKASGQQITESPDAVLGTEHYPVDHGELLEH